MHQFGIKYLAITIFIFLLGIGRAMAQNNVTMTMGPVYVDGCHNPTGTIFDNGGSAGTYSNSFDGYVVINASIGVNITISGNYNTESCCDKITIYDGPDATGNVLYGPAGGIGTVNVTSTTGYLTLHFHTDGSVTREGFALSYSCSSGSGACSNKPYDLTVGTITNNSVALSWSANNPSDQFVLTVGGTQTTVTGTSYTITGLAFATAYQVALSSIADTDNLCCTARRKIRTSCNTISRADLPYSYGFEDATGSGQNYDINDCWSSYTSGSSSIYPDAAHPYQGNYALYASNTNSDYITIVALPEYVDQLTETMVEFFARTETNTMTSAVEVGVMTDPLDSTTFTMVETVSFNSNSYQYHYVSLESYSGPGHYVAMRMKGRTQEVYLDNVTLRLVPDCADATGLTVEAVTATSMAVSWTQAGPSAATNSGYEVIVTPSAGGTPMTMTTSDNPVIISGLQPETDYRVQVRILCTGGLQGNWDSLTVRTSSLCGGLSSPSGSGNYTTSGVPVYSSWGNTIAQTIFSASQLQAMGMSAGTIQAMTYTWTNNSNYAKEFSIYLGTTSQTYYATSTPINSSMTLVYSGAHPLNTSGTHTYNFTTPFNWDGTSSLVVTTLMNQPQDQNHSSSGFYGVGTNGSEYKSIYKYRDHTPYTISDLGLTGWNRSYTQTNVSFYSCIVQNGCLQPLVLVSDVGFNSATLHWSIDSTSNSWDIAYKRTDDTSWTIVATAYPSNEYLINNLERGVMYDFRVTAVCDSGTNASVVTASTLCRNNTFNYDDLYAENVTCYTGSYAMPRLVIGVVNQGSSSEISRHTVHYDRSERDPRTGSLLHTVPEGYCTSVRLGNWETGAQGESITYTYHIDTNDYNLMLLKYAAVLQDPNHSSDEQPRFTFNITDTNGNLLSQCYSADFIANANLGWNSASNNVLWKDWTTVGIDLDPLQGQTINITLTSYDCDQGGHYGYAYFVIDLDNKGLSSTSCSSDENVFRAPSGFAYRWYSALNPTVTLATTDTLHVYQAGTYYCDLSFVGAPNDAAHANCFFTMAAIAGERHPWARFTPTYIDTASCTYTWMRMQNQSIITSDTAHTDSIGNGCESYLWRFDDGTSSTEMNPRHAFTPGNHSVTLYAMLANGGCIDTATATFLIATPCMFRDTVSRTLCQGDTLIMFDSVLTTAGTYELDSIFNGDSLWLRTLHLTVLETSADTLTINQCGDYLWALNGTTYSETGVYNDTAANAVGCDSIITLNLTITPNIDTTILDTICQGQLFFFGGQHLGAAGIYIDSLQVSSSSNCDSIIRLQLTVNDTSLTDTMATACDIYQWHGRAYATSVVDTLTGAYLNRAGCDSTVVLHLTLNQSSVGDTVADICDQFDWYGNSYTTSTVDTLRGHYRNQRGCDSTVVLHLTVRQSSAATYNDTCLENQLPRQYLHLTSHGDTAGAQLTIANAVGCDSLITYNLHVWHNVHMTIDSSICDDALATFSWHGLQSSATALPDSYIGNKPTLTDTLQVFLQTSHGADSTVTLVLHINPTYQFDLVDTICNGMAFVFNSHNYYTTGTYIDTLPTYHGCDSIAKIDLFVKDTVMVDTVADACDSYTWYSQNYSEEGQYIHFRPHTAANECDTAIRMTLTLRHSTFGDTAAICCDSFAWYGQQYGNALPTPTHTLSNSVGCDSTVRLHLAVNHSDAIDLYDTIYQGDTIVFEGEEYTQPGIYVYQDTNRAGCDSTRTLHLVWRYMVNDAIADSICQGGSYLFADSVLTEAGVYYDTIFSNSYPTPDTLRTLTLTTVPLPEISLSSEHFCGKRPHYNLTAHTTVPFLRWGSVPDDPALDGQRGDTLVTVNPSDTTVYYVTADYRQEPMCPVNDSIVVAPIGTLIARIETYPGNLTADRRTLTAYDRSGGKVDQREWYVWYDEEEPFYYGDGNSITLEVPAYVGELQLSLMVSNEFCDDADTVSVPILASSLFIPNIFTPSLESNNLFRAVSTGVTEFEIWVYDRRGDLVYHSTDINEGWDGTHEGRKCMQAAYVYKCRYKERTNPGGYQTKTGTVTLVR